MKENPFFCSEIENVIALQEENVSSQIGLWLNETINVAQRFASRDYNAFLQRAKDQNFREFTEVGMNDEIVEYLKEGKRNQNATLSATSKDIIYSFGSR